MIGKTIAKKGIAESERAIYGRLKLNDYMSAQLDKIRQHHVEAITRDLVPIAIKNHRKLLKDKTISPTAQLQAVKLAYDVEFKTDQPQRPMGNTINIGELKVLVTGDVQ
jgi:hypothetical protein